MQPIMNSLSSDSPASELSVSESSVSKSSVTIADAQKSPGLPPGTRYVWATVLIGLMIILCVRLVQGRIQADHAKHQVSMHESPVVLEQKLASLSAEQRKTAVFSYARDESAGLRFASIDLLVETGSPAALDVVEQDFKDNASEVRKRALETLIDMKQGEERGLRLLLAAARDDDEWVREDAVQQISLRAGKRYTPVDKRAVPTLMAALRDHDSVVSAAASNGLCKLTGHSWKLSMIDPAAKRAAIVAQWEQWWQDVQKGRQMECMIPAEFLNIPVLFPTRSDPAPEFNQIDVTGRPFGTNDLRGKITLINFWGSWCPPCRGEIPEFIKISKIYKDRNVVVIGMACSEKGSADLEDWCRNNQVSYRQIMATNEVQKAFGDIEELPVSFLVDSKGNIRYRWDGERDFETFQAAIERLLHETAK